MGFVCVVFVDRSTMATRQQTDINKLQPDQLQQLRKSLSDDVQMITNSYGNLKVAYSRFQYSLEALDVIVPENENKEILVPLTGSLYIPGTLSNVEKVMVDIGTGYYVER